MSRKAKIFLGVSLAANLFFIGLLGGTAWRGDGPHHGRDRGGAGALDARSIWRALPEERRAAARERYRDRMYLWREKTKDIETAQDAALAVLAADTFDRAAFDRAQEALATASDAQRRFANGGIGALIDELSTEERKALAEATAERITRHREARKKRWQRAAKRWKLEQQEQ